MYDLKNTPWTASLSLDSVFATGVGMESDDSRAASFSASSSRFTCLRIAAIEVLKVPRSWFLA